MRAFFFVGNRRSGTTVFVRALNMNSQVFCAFERHLIWLLYLMQRDGGLYDTYTGHPVDGRLHRWTTLGNYGLKFLELERRGICLKEMRKVFYDIAWRYALDHHYSRQGEPEPLWIGEKNPEETGLPEVADFAFRLFPSAKYLHVVRHPMACVGSKAVFARSARLRADNWHKPRDQLLRDWVKHEQNVLRVKLHAPVLTIRYEDFCIEPDRQMAKVSHFFGVRPWPTIESMVRLHQNHKYDMGMADVCGLAGLMERYGYSPS